MIHGFLKNFTWTLQSCYMDLLKLLRGFAKDILCISRPLPNKTKLKFDKDFKACWSFCFELKLLNESKYSLPWVRSAFGNVLSTANSELAQKWNRRQGQGRLLSAVSNLNMVWGAFVQLHLIGRREKKGNYALRMPIPCLMVWEWDTASDWFSWQMRLNVFVPDTNLWQSHKNTNKHKRAVLILFNK